MGVGGGGGWPYGANGFELQVKFKCCLKSFKLGVFQSSEQEKKASTSGSRCLGGESNLTCKRYIASTADEGAICVEAQTAFVCICSKCSLTCCQISDRPQRQWPTLIYKCGFYFQKVIHNSLLAKSLHRQMYFWSCMFGNWCMLTRKSLWRTLLMLAAQPIKVHTSLSRPKR